MRGITSVWQLWGANYSFLSTENQCFCRVNLLCFAYLIHNSLIIHIIGDLGKDSRDGTRLSPGRNGSIQSSITVRHVQREGILSLLYTFARTRTSFVHWIFPVPRPYCSSLVSRIYFGEVLQMCLIKITKRNILCDRGRKDNFAANVRQIDIKL